jgi:hypothetical protein
VGKSVRFERVARWVSRQRKITPAAAYVSLMRGCTAEKIALTRMPPLATSSASATVNAEEMTLTVDEACERRFFGLSAEDDLEGTRARFILAQHEFPRPNRSIQDLIMACGWLDADEVGRWLRAEDATPWLDSERRRSGKVKIEDAELLTRVRKRFDRGDKPSVDLVAQDVQLDVQNELGVKVTRKRLREFAKRPEFELLRGKRGVHKDQ